MNVIREAVSLEDRREQGNVMVTPNKQRSLPRTHGSGLEVKDSYQLLIPSKDVHGLPQDAG